MHWECRAPSKRCGNKCGCYHPSNTFCWLLTWCYPAHKLPYYAWSTWRVQEWSPNECIARNVISSEEGESAAAVTSRQPCALVYCKTLTEAHANTRKCRSHTHESQTVLQPSKRERICRTTCSSGVHVTLERRTCLASLHALGAPPETASGDLCVLPASPCKISFRHNAKSHMYAAHEAPLRDAKAAPRSDAYVQAWDALGRCEWST